MALTADNLDGFLPLLATSDTKSKLTIANNLINFLAEPESSIECSDIGQFIDSLIPWMQSSNNKVSQAGIEAMGYVVDRMGTDFRPYVATVLPPIIDRLGDNKEVVREKAQLLLLRLAEREVLTPQALLERLTPAFSHKNGKIREEVLQCLQRTLTEHGAASLSVSRLVPHIVKLLSDPMASVRDTAFNTLVEVYRHVGERLRHDLLKKHTIPPAKLPMLMARFDELRLVGDLLPSALAVDSARGAGASTGEDEPDRAAPRRATSVPRRTGPPSAAAPVSRSFAAPVSANPSAASEAAATADAGAPRLRRASSLRRAGSSPATPPGGGGGGGGGGGQAGAVDEDTFQRAFAEVVPASVFSVRELEEQLAAVRDTVGDPAKDWSKRVDAMRRLRALVAAACAAGGSLEEQLPTQLRSLEAPLCTAARDLRSQVVREACLTVAYVSERLRARADRFAEALLPHLLQLIQNSAKVMASAGNVSARFLLRNTPAPRLVPPLCRELASSKSRDIRRACAELLALLLTGWPSSALERHAVLLQDAVRRGIADADPEARLSARKAYWAYRSHFPELAEQLLNSLDASYRRALNGEHTLSNSSSSNSLHHQAGSGRCGGAVPRLRMSGSAQDVDDPTQPIPSDVPHRLSSSLDDIHNITKGSTENLHQQMGSGGGAGGSLLHRTPSLTRQHRSGIPVLAHKTGGDHADGSSGSARRGAGGSAGVGVRSSSAIDLQAAQRAKARAQYAALARHKVGSGASLLGKKTDHPSQSVHFNAPISPENPHEISVIDVEDNESQLCLPNKPLRPTLYCRRNGSNDDCKVDLRSQFQSPLPPPLRRRNLHFKKDEERDTKTGEKSSPQPPIIPLKPLPSARRLDFPEGKHANVEPYPTSKGPTRLRRLCEMLKPSKDDQSKSTFSSTPIKPETHHYQDDLKDDQSEPTLPSAPVRPKMYHRYHKHSTEDIQTVGISEPTSPCPPDSSGLQQEEENTEDSDTDTIIEPIPSNVTVEPILWCLIKHTNTGARPRKSSDAGIGSLTTSAATSPERVGRTRSRVAGVSQSQPSSRSGSPSSRLSYATYSARMEAARGGGGSGDATDSGRPRRLTGIPRSTGASREASRETSPSRFGPAPFGSKLSCRGRSLAGLERPSVRPVMAQKILQQSREAESAIADALTCDSLESGDYARGGHPRKRLFDDHSDDSETSSVCSERSFDSYRRPSDSFSWSGSQQRLYRENLEASLRDISEIIANCASTHWGDRKEGLVGLLVFLQTGQLLRPNELQLVTEIFTKMFMDSHTKVFSLFLDTLWELLQAHRADLNDWLYVLLTRLLNKLGTDLLNSIHTKIQRLLAHVREAFPPDLQLACVLRFLTDATQTPNARVRTATLTHLTALCAACGDTAAMPTRPPAPAALAKIVSLAADSKQPGEVRRAARGALVAMFDLAAPQVAMMLTELPQEFQEIASPLLHSHLRRSSGGGGGGTGGSPPSPGRASPSGALSSPGTPQTPRQTALASRAIGAEEEDLNPEEVYRSLRRTTAEIQSYPFGDAAPGTGNMGNAPTALGGKLPDRDRDTTSQDSGISQMSAGAGDKLDALEEHFEALSLTRNNSGRSSSLSSPTHRLNSLKDYNGIDTDSSLGHTENGFLSRESQEDSEALRKALEIVRPQDSPNGTEVPLTASTARRDAFYTLQTLAKEANAAALTEHFKVLLRVLLELLGRPDEPQRGAVLGVLSELLLRREVAPGFNNYVELLVLKVLEAYKEYSKDVPRMAELCSASVGAVLPPDTVIRVLNPLITTGEFPVNLGAIKMLMKVVEARPKDLLEPHLDAVMPALIKAYNNEESSVRKSAVFCMVALHNALGEAALQPHLAALSGSKLKLLNLYIRRAQSGSGSGGGGGGGSGSSGNASAPTSPKNNQAP